MPELPEVETIRRSLEKYAVGRKIADVEVLLPRTIKHLLVPEFCSRVRGQEILRLDRRGKYLMLLLASGDTLLLHLRMTGRFYWRRFRTPYGKHVRAIFQLDDGGWLFFEDVRTFGEIHLLSAKERERFPALLRMGPEPLTEGFRTLYLRTALQKCGQRIKGFLLDQEKVAGLGNIYVDEALFFAGIHPLREARSLNRDEIFRLHRAVNQVIAEGIADGGTTFRDYVNGEGREGFHQQKLRVYHREGEPCLVCGTAIEKIRVVGRGTRFCPHCQPLHDGKAMLVGLTGGIASGKSTVSRRLLKLGAKVIDTDKIAHALAKPHQPLWKIYLEHFGKTILDENDCLCREKIAACVFSDPEERRWIDGAAHPLIAEAVKKKIAAFEKKGERILFLDVPLLFEAEWNRMVDRIWLVYVSEDVQIARLMKRNGYTKEAAKARIRSQFPLREKRRRADCIIENDGTLKEMTAQVTEAWEELQSL
ncbi:DNA-formamidopyrimidine glycosylase [Selenomonas sp.]|uniref:DNA-formamidopyrimidine glycosylase n=1 Tax=Selenomonas sp. TaxID=2053611 RepID=UPI003FA2732B